MGSFHRTKKKVDMMDDLMLFVIVFFIYVVLDIAWTKYTQSIANNNKLKACVWAAIIPVLPAVS